MNKQSKLKEGMRGQAVTNLVGLMVALIILVAVLYPIMKTTVSDLISYQQITGTGVVIANIIPLMVLVAGVVLVSFLFTRQ